MCKLIEAADKYRDLILEAQDYIWKNPETGYKEVKTSAYMEKAFEALGYDLVKAGDIPGFYCMVDTGRPGPEILVLGELDSLICPTHPDADPETGAVHCCGHSAQSAALLGIAAALKEDGALDDLCGKIRLCAVPAEELIEIEYRSELMRQGKIRYFGGKSEFLRRGYFDGVDVALMVHTTQGETAAVRGGSVGCMAKRVIYKGKSAHAGGSPWNGCNALYAATQGISAINAIRETFRESDIIRVHPIITKGGGAVNAIPDEVIIESYVRGKTFEAIVDANQKVNRALCGAALSLGANVEIVDSPGYSPCNNAEGMIQLVLDAAKEIDLPCAYDNRFGSGSTDMGDLSAVMPAVHPYCPGAEGISHGDNYRISDPEMACVTSAKWQLKMLELLLKDDGARAKEIKANFVPRFESVQAYLDYTAGLFSDGERIAYREDGVAEVKGCSLAADTSGCNL